MARSYKEPWVKDPSNSYMKRVYARAHRRVSRQILDHFAKTHPREVDYMDLWEEGESDVFINDIVFPHRRELINQYSICDFVFYCKEEKYKRK